MITANSTKAPVSLRFQAEKPTLDAVQVPAATVNVIPDTLQWQQKPQKPSVLKALQQATPRMVDALGLFVWSNVLIGPGHLFMLPIALADGAVAINEFRKAAGMAPLAKSDAAQAFFEKAKASLDQAKINAASWEKPLRPLYKLGLATTAAGILIHPLLFLGLGMMALPNLARDLGITVNIFKQLLTQGKDQV